MGQGGALANRGRGLMAPWALPGPVGVREIENDWIETADGVRLAVSLWLPDMAERAPVVLESIPYRKRDSTRGYSSWWGRKLAERGVAYARLDCRGSGDSGGFLRDEYLPQEQADNVTAIGWLAAQPWCNGAVGMRGVSWGGFSTLQAAALAPPALKAIMPMCASDRRYTDDAHYVGGAFALTGLKWATSFKAVMAGPPDPDIFGPRLGSGVDGAAGGVARDCGRVAASPARGRVLAAGLGGVRSRRHPLPGLSRRGLDRSLQRDDPAPARAHAGPRQGADRAVAARLSVAGHARPRPRLGVRGGALVERAPGRRGHRDHGRAARADVPRRAVGHRGGAGRDRRPLGRRTGVAAGDRSLDFAARRRRSRRDGGARDRHAPRSQRRRHDDARVGPVRRANLPAGTVGRRRRLAGIRHRPARRAARRARNARAPPTDCSRPTGCEARRAALRGDARRPLVAGQLLRPQPDAPRRATPSPRR